MTKTNTVLVRTAVTHTQIAKINLLQQCVFLPASFDKKFARDMVGRTELTEKQAEYLDKLFYKYRKQISKINPNIPIIKSTK